MRFFLISVCFFCFASLVSCTNKRIIDYPEYEANGGESDVSFSIDRIELTDTASIFNMSFHHFPGYWVRIDSDTKLVGNTTGKTYSLLKIEGMMTDTTEWMQKEAFRNATLYFEPIDPQDKEVDFIESDEWTVKRLKLYDNSKGKIKTNISGTLDLFGGSWLRIIEAGDDFQYGKTFIVPVRDGKFNYNIYTNEPRLFRVMIGKRFRSGSSSIASFWSEGDSVRLDYPNGDIENFSISGGPLTKAQNEFIKKSRKEENKIYNGYLEKINDLERKGLLKTKRYMNLEYRFENEAIGRERENILDTLIQLGREKKHLTPEGQKLMEEWNQFYNNKRDSINQEFIKYYLKEFEIPDMINLGNMYQEIRENNLGFSGELLKLFQKNYKDFHPEHPYHKYLMEMSRIYDYQ